MYFFEDIFLLFYPKVCLNCENQLNKHEKVLCVACRFDLPLTNFSAQKENILEQVFYGRVPIEYGTALFYYQRKGVIKNLIHALKYNKKQEVGTVLGEWLGKEMKASARCPTFDFIVPVPMHKNKLKRRGYNQVTKFGKALSKILNTPYHDTVLLRKLDSNTQTAKSRIDRFENLKEKFYTSTNETFKDKHILLIDDVITTGATIEACVIKLLEAKGIKISIAAMAYRV